MKKALWQLLIALFVFLTSPAYSDLSTTFRLITEYEDALGLYADPLINSLSKSEEINTLQILKDKCALLEECYWIKIQDEITSSPHNLNQQLVAAFLIGAERDLDNRDTKLLRKQLNLLGLKELARHLGNLNSNIEQNKNNELAKLNQDDTRATEKQEKTDVGNEIKKEKPEDNIKNQDEKQSDKLTKIKQENTEPLSEPSAAYKPHTKDLPKNNNAHNLVAAVNLNTPVFGQIIYDNIDRANIFPFQATTQAWKTEQSLMSKEPTDKYIKIYPNGKQDVRLIMPTGYVPGEISPSSGAIEIADNNGYRLHLNKHLYEITIPLYKIKPYRLNDYLKETYTKPVGIELKELPEKIQTAIIKQFDQKNIDNPEAIATAIKQHLAQNYLYGDKALPETDPIAALKTGVFQCDMAAYIMVTVLRDIYRIPSRIVSDYRAQHAVNNKGEYSYLLASENNHAWVEVFIGGNWQYFDPTPQNRSNNLQPDQNAASTPQNSNSNPQSTQNSAPTPQNINNKQQSVKEPVLEYDILQDLSVNWDSTADIVFPDENEQFTLLKKLAKQNILKYILNPFQSSNDIQRKIKIYSDTFADDADDEELKGILTVAAELYKEPHNSLTNWLNNLYQKQDIDAIAVDLPKISKILNNYHEVSTRNYDIDYLQETLWYIKTCLREIYASKLNHDGQNASLIAEAQNIYAEVKLDEDKIPLILYKYTDFIVKPPKARESGKTWQQESLTRGPDILPARHFTNWKNVIPTDPRFDLFENIKHGTAFEMTNRKKINIETKKPSTNKKKITIIYTMPGFFLEEFQTRKIIRGYLATAFEERALLDTTAEHQVINYFRLEEYSKRYNSQDIENNLLEAIKTISEKEDVNNPFAIANIIIIKGAYSGLNEEINYKRIKEQSDAIHPDTDLRVMFIEISPSATTLIDVANNAAKMGMRSPGVYQLITPNDISEIIKLAKEIDLEEYKKYFSWPEMAESTGYNIMDSLKGIIDNAERINSNIEESNKYNIKHNPRLISNFIKEVNSQITKNVDSLTYVERPSEVLTLNPESVSKFRTWIIEHYIHKNPELFQAILADFYKQLPLDKKGLTYNTLIQLKRLIELN